MRESYYYGNLGDMYGRKVGGRTGKGRRKNGIGE